MTEKMNRPGEEITKAAQDALCEGAMNQVTPLGYQAPADDCDSVPTIYAAGALLYRQAGWRAVLPLPPKQKRPPPDKFTGREGGWPTDAQIADWMARSPNNNLGLRVEYGIVGLDIDAYDGKTGAETLREAERRWGPLPPTYRSTSRHDDPISGHRLYRVPVGILFRDRISFADPRCGDIEIIQPHHRYLVAWPSIHPTTGTVYRFYGHGGAMLPEGVVPPVEELPELPAEWVEGLAKDALRDEVFDGSAPNRSVALRGQVNQELYEKLIGLADLETAPDRLVAARLEAALTDLMSGTGSRYDCTRDHVAALMRMQAVGRVGVPRALRDLYPAYVLEVTDRRPREVAEAEFLRFTQGAAMLIAATSLASKQQDAGHVTDADAGAAEYALSWAPIDLTDVIAGDYSCVTPTLFPRTDGVCLFYPGMTHSVHGESESGKSLIVQAECVRLINDGRRVLYLDFESDQGSVIDRLRQLGVHDHALAEHFHYLRPEVSPNSSETERAGWESILGTEYALAVIDGVTEALTVFGRGSMDNDDLAAWSREVPKKIADRTGAAVVLIDHVVKNKSMQGRFAIGGQAKMATLTGAAYTVEILQPIGVGMRGVVGLRIAKDRPGQVRNTCGVFRKGDRTQTAARVVIDSTGDQTTVTVEPWDTNTPHESTGGEFRPTHLMQRVSRVMEAAAEPMNKNAAYTQAGGKKETTLLAFDILVQEGYLAAQGKWRGHPLYVSVKPYSEGADLLTQHHHDGEPLPALRSV